MTPLARTAWLVLALLWPTGVSFPMQDFLSEGSTRIPTLAGLKFTHPDLMAYQFVLSADNGRCEWIG